MYYGWDSGSLKAWTEKMVESGWVAVSSSLKTVFIKNVLKVSNYHMCTYVCNNEKRIRQTVSELQ